MGDFDAALWMPCTEYFLNNVLVKRPYLRPEWCRDAITQPIKREVQSIDGRVRHWIHVVDLNRHLRVVTLADGVTLHNAFPDRRFRP